MIGFFKNYRKYTEFLPIILIGLLFVSEAEMEKNALNMSCQMTITIVTVLIFFLIALKYPKAKMIAFFIALVLWIVLVCIKKRYMIL